MKKNIPVKLLIILQILLFLMTFIYGCLPNPNDGGVKPEARNFANLEDFVNYLLENNNIALSKDVIIEKMKREIFQTKGDENPFEVEFSQDGETLTFTYTGEKPVTFIVNYYIEHGSTPGSINLKWTSGLLMLDKMDSTKGMTLISFCSDTQNNIKTNEIVYNAQRSYSDPTTIVVTEKEMTQISGNWNIIMSEFDLFQLWGDIFVNIDPDDPDFNHDGGDGDEGDGDEGDGDEGEGEGSYSTDENGNVTYTDEDGNTTTLDPVTAYYNEETGEIVFVNGDGEIVTTMSPEEAENYGLNQWATEILVSLLINQAIAGGVGALFGGGWHGAIIGSFAVLVNDIYNWLIDHWGELGDLLAALGDLLNGWDLGHGNLPN
jgi:hypothetical protein